METEDPDTRCPQYDVSPTAEDNLRSEPLVKEASSDRVFSGGVVRGERKYNNGRWGDDEEPPTETEGDVRRGSENHVNLRPPGSGGDCNQNGSHSADTPTSQASPNTPPLRDDEDTNNRSQQNGVASMSGGNGQPSAAATPSNGTKSSSCTATVGAAAAATGSRSARNHHGGMSNYQSTVSSNHYHHHHHSSSGGGCRDGEPMSLLVRHLKFTTSPCTVRKYFEQCGEVKDVYLPLDYERGNPRGFGFVEFTSARDAETALRELHDTELEGNRISISIAQHGRKSPSTMRQRSSGGTGGRRRFTSRREPYGDGYGPDRSPPYGRRYGRGPSRGYDMDRGCRFDYEPQRYSRDYVESSRPYSRSSGYRGDNGPSGSYYDRRRSPVPPSSSRYADEPPVYGASSRAPPPENDYRVASRRLRSSRVYEEEPL